MLEVEVVVETLAVLVLLATMAVVGLLVLVLLGRVEKLEAQGDLEKEVLKARRDNLARLEEEEAARWTEAMPTRDTETIREKTISTTLVKGKAKDE